MKWNRDHLFKESRQRGDSEGHRGNKNKVSFNEKKLSSICGPRRMNPGRSKQSQDGEKTPARYHHLLWEGAAHLWRLRALPQPLLQDSSYALVTPECKG